MAKTVKISIQLVPESQEVDNIILTKEIIESLNCAWLYRVLSIEIGQSRSLLSRKQFLK
jgi:hypothetical protein